MNVETGNYDAMYRNNEERIKKDVNDFIYIISETVSWIKILNATINALIALINLKQKLIWGRIDQNEYELTKRARIDQMKTRWVRIDQNMCTSCPKWVRIDLGTNWLEYESTDSVPYEPRHEKTCLRSFRPGKTQTGLFRYTQDQLETWNFGFSKYRYYTI